MWLLFWAAEGCGPVAWRTARRARQIGGGRWRRWVGWGTGAAGKTAAREPQGGATCTDREGAHTVMLRGVI